MDGKWLKINFYDFSIKSDKIRLLDDSPLPKKRVREYMRFCSCAVDEAFQANSTICRYINMKFLRYLVMRTTENWSSAAHAPKRM